MIGPYDIELVASPMGGDWAVPTSERGAELCHALLPDAFANGPICGGAYILEPQEAADVVDMLRVYGARVRTASGEVL